MDALVTFNDHEAAIAAAIFEQIFPKSDDAAGATEIGVVHYVDLALAGAYTDCVEIYRLGIAALDRAVRAEIGVGFAEATPKRQRAFMTGMERGHLKGSPPDSQVAFFDLLLTHCREGLFSDPIYGGNRDKLGWKTLGHPGVWLENSAEENLSTEPVTKGGEIQSLADIGFGLGGRAGAGTEVPGFDLQRGTEPPSGKADVVLIGVGAVGGFIAPMLAEAGLKVIGLEAGPYRQPEDFVPDELGSAYYCRQNMGKKFMSEEIRWRTGEGEPTRNATYSLGRMMNGVGGSVIHYGAWLRRFHPHHFRFRSHVTDRWGAGAIPEGCTLADWPVGYDDLEPYFTRAEQEIGVAGEDELNPFIRRSRPLPLPPTRNFRLGDIFSRAAREQGLHPHPVSIGMNTAPFNGFPAMDYTAWNGGFGSTTGDKWHPGLTSVPRALATGNFDLRTHCRVLRVLTDAGGRATGVEYVDVNGRVHVQRAETVILCSYTWENVRLMFLSGSDRHPDGLGNSTGQLGKHLMVKMFCHVDGHFPETIFNRHTGPAAQAIVLDDYVSKDFDSFSHGFIGGATLGAENQFLPIQISRETLPPGTPAWGAKYKAYVRDWQHLGVVRIQYDALPHQANFMDLDPFHRDRSGIGMPVIRATYALRENEQRQANWFEERSERLLKEMGAARMWRGPAFTGVGSSHDCGGARMSDDPADGVVDRDLRVHDTPGLYVMSLANFPTCPGINPTLTLWAMCARATDRLIARLQSGEESTR